MAYLFRNFKFIVIKGEFVIVYMVLYLILILINNNNIWQSGLNPVQGQLGLQLDIDEGMRGLRREISEVPNGLQSERNKEALEVSDNCSLQLIMEPLILRRDVARENLIRIYSNSITGNYGAQFAILSIYNQLQREYKYLFSSIF